jgi:hypothetical protein
MSFMKSLIACDATPAEGTHYHSAMGIGLDALPGGDLVERGLADDARGWYTVESLLVSIGSPRLATLGFQVANPIPDASRRLYERLHAEDADSAHGRYNALVRRLVSFERAAAGTRA